MTSHTESAPGSSDTASLKDVADGSKEPGPILTPEHFGGLVEYNKYSHLNLYNECVRRGIAVSKFARQEVLVKKLKLNDGLPDFDDHKQWPIDRLKSECRDRGLPENRKRDELVKQLHRHESRLRQQAAQKRHVDMPGAPAPLGDVVHNPLQVKHRDSGRESLDDFKFSYLNPKAGAAEEISHSLAREPLGTLDQNAQPKRGLGQPKNFGLGTGIPVSVMKGIDLPIRGLHQQGLHLLLGFLNCQGPLRTPRG